jgi:hypothetical protein
MKVRKAESAIGALLDGNLQVRQELMQSPQVAHLPFMGTREHFFLLVNPHARSETNKEQLINMCFAAAQLVIGSSFLTDEKALEISAFIDVPKQENLRRAFRLPAHDTAFVQAMQISAADLLSKSYI